jgi:hypothetical protein
MAADADRPLEDELLGGSDDEQQQTHVDIPQQPQVMIL